MGSSLTLFTVRGITIRVHFTFPLILIWGAIQFGFLNGQGVSGAIFGVVVFLLLFAIVVLHELGHSFAAQYYGVPVNQIVLLPIGGVAQLARMPEHPIQEFVVAIAGPLVNFVLAFLMIGVNILVGLETTFAGPETLMETMGDLSLRSIYIYTFVSNLFLGIFNLIPAFPMDGGRVLRALLATQLEYVTATRIAVSVGQTLALFFGLWGFLGGGFFIILIAIFIYLGAGQEGQLVQVRHTLRNLVVDQAYSREAHTLTRQSTLQEAIDLTLSSFQADFPVCEDGRLVGLLPQSKVLETLQTRGPEVTVGEVMLTEVEPVKPQEEIFDVQQRLQESSLDAAPVVADDGQFLGMITSRDIGELYRLVSNQPELVNYLKKAEA